MPASTTGQLEPNILIVLCTAGGLLALPIGAGVGLVVAAIGNRLLDAVRRPRISGEGGHNRSWVTRRQPRDP